MRKTIGMLMLGPSMALAATSPVESSIDHLVKSLQLTRHSESSWQKCLKQSPRAKAFAEHDLIRHYCLIRHGADRKHAVFIGVHAVKLLESRGELAAAEVLEELSVYSESEM